LKGLGSLKESFSLALVHRVIGSLNDWLEVFLLVHNSKHAIMAKNDVSYRAKMSRANDLLTYISGFENYLPTRPEERIEGMTAFIAQLLEINARVSSTNDSYVALVDDRQDAFDNNEDSLNKLFIQIKAAVDSQYGKASSEADSINRQMALIRGAKVQKPVEDPETEAGEKAYDKVDRSYGAMTQVLNDIIAALTNYVDYETSNERVKLETLKATAAKLTDFNAGIARKKQEIRSVTQERIALFDELRARSQRIKSYVKGQYGMNSNEYILIKGLKF